MASTNIFSIIISKLGNLQNFYIVILFKIDIAL